MKAQQRSATDQKPSAFIVNPKDRGRKSVKSGDTIYLTPDQNFEIELFNPLKEAVLSEIKVNGKSVSSTGLVIRPGERCYLDCFIDDKKKFVFKTYDVENTVESKEAISKNGLVEIFFYKEETLKLDNWKQRVVPVYYPVYPYLQYPWSYPYLQYPWSSYPQYYGTVTTTAGGGSITVSNSSSNLNINTCSGAIYNGSNALYSGNCVSSALYSDSNIDVNSFMETGRIEKGESSSQKFEDIEMNFESYCISSVVYHLLPESQKPIESKDIKKKFCENCGRSLKGTENFCSDCGCKLN